MGDDSWREIESGWEDVDEDLDAPVSFDDTTPVVRSTDASPSPEPEPGATFEEEGDTVFEGDQPTVDYLADEVPEHVAEFLGEAAGHEEVIVPLPRADGAQEDALPPERKDRSGLQPASLTLILLAVGAVVAVAAVVYAALL